jgi:hypothetical protein
MRTYNFRQCQELLQVDPKTFGRWLEKAKIDPSQQVNLADPRQKFLTEEQILMLAQAHGREVHFPAPEQSEDTSPTVTLAQLYDRLTALEQVIASRFDQVEEQVRTLVADLRRDLATQATATPAPHPQAAPKPVKVAAAAPVKARASTRPRAKKGAKAKSLPRGLVALPAFRNLHGVSEKAVEHAIEVGRLPVVRGKWLVNSRYVATALDGQGRQQFYALFSERQGFQRCEHCPSSAQGYHS